LAVTTAAKGQALGAALLVDAITRADESGIGAYALVVDAKDDAARAFYEHLGFMVLPGTTSDAITCLCAAVSFARRPLRRARNRSNWDAG
jgi:predicted N-acetyltransferase YhbS